MQVVISVIIFKLFYNLLGLQVSKYNMCSTQEWQRQQYCEGECLYNMQTSCVLDNYSTWYNVILLTYIYYYCQIKLLIDSFKSIEISDLSPQVKDLQYKDAL